MAFGRTNYLIMGAGIITLIIGFIIMTMDKETHGFGFLGLTLGPVIVMIGFLVQIAAILYKPRKEE